MATAAALSGLPGLLTGPPQGLPGFPPAMLQAAATAALQGTQPSAYVSVTGMVNAATLTDDQEYADVSVSALLNFEFGIQFWLSDKLELSMHVECWRAECASGRLFWNIAVGGETRPTVNAHASLLPLLPLQVIDDLREECSKFGAVVEVRVPRPTDPSQAAALMGTGNFGKVGYFFLTVGYMAMVTREINGMAEYLDNMTTNAPFLEAVALLKVSHEALVGNDMFM